MSLTGKTREQVTRLFRLVDRGQEWEADPIRNEPGITIVTAPGEAFSLHGEGYLLLHDLSDLLAHPAAGGTGRSLQEAEHLLLGACNRYLTEGAEKSLVWLQARLSEEAQTWTVIRPLEAFTLAPLLTVGKCRIQRGLPESPFGSWEDFITRAFPAFSISTDVVAHDSEAAKIAAEEHFGEAVAIMQIGSRRGAAIVRPDTVVVSASGQVQFGKTSKGSLSLTSLSDKRGNLLPGTEPLSTAARKLEADRTDWERRTLAAGRWMARALSAEWPSEALLSLMIALESIFVESRQTLAKGRTVAREVSRRWRLRPWSEPEQGAWLEDLYQRRNDIAHEARSYRNELDVERLADLTWLAVSWAAWHLNPMHAPQTTACKTWAEALADHPS